ncbi:hypothetical protein PFDG_01038 [Plasmodium falciparum Dd2]|uniref:Rifin n=1 Tax=Plasmodium falciparum (isolate Dd2) TaxID=57267 RepID=A0A0L7LYC4_PLAF4|nr:hypothetical protein PFDG_01038 [Plasmodium falciparum Dd2]
MKDHYINILLFALPLNILVIPCYVYNQRNYYITPRHTETNRSLCECELYSPTNYDSDPEMKRVMQQFVDRTTQRFHEYDERMKTTRQKCREQCDKEIQKIILKDKLEKHMAQQLSTLETKITTDDIPTCVCEKSIEDKMEKTCLKCGGVLGGGVAPAWGLLSGIVYTGWKAAALAAAKSSAIAEGAMAGKAAGDIAGAAKVIDLIESTFYINELGGTKLQTLFTAKTYTNVSMITEALYSKINGSCMSLRPGINMSDPICNLVWQNLQGSLDKNSVKAIINEKVEKAVAGAEQAAKAKAAEVAAAKTPVLEARNIAEVEAATTTYYTPIIASIVAIVVIVLIMVIIYLILRYRRKKKMKKKLQYIKLLEE